MSMVGATSTSLWFALSDNSFKDPVIDVAKILGTIGIIMFNCSATVISLDMYKRTANRFTKTEDAPGM